MLININDIKVTDRIRKDFGDIQELADDIKQNGLINPPVVTPDTYELIAGERRLKALKLLGYSQIEVRPMSVKDAIHQLRLEISENENRKDFSFNEKMIWAKMLEDEYKKIAKENQESTQFGSTVKQDFVKPIITNKQVAQEVGFGNKETYRQAKYIHENATDNIIRELDDGKLSINKAYIQIKKEKDELERKVKQLESRKPEVVEKVIDNTDYSSIEKNKRLESELEKIKKEKIELETTNRLLEMSKKSSENISESYKKLSEEYKKQSEEYMEIKSKIIDMGLDPNGEYNLYGAASEIAKLTKEIEDLLLNKLAPLKYKNFMIAVKNSDVLRNNFKNTLDMVNDWYISMREYIKSDLENKNINNIIDMEER